MRPLIRATKRRPTHVTDVIIQAGNALDRMTAARAKHLGVTPRQLMALLIVDAYPDITQGDLARRMGFDKRLASQVVSRLLGAGLLVRRRSAEHKGAYALSLSRKAKRRIDALRAAQHEVDRAVERTLGDDIAVVEDSLLDVIEMERTDHAEED